MPLSIISEEQEFAILEAMVTNHIDTINLMQLPPAIDNLIGAGSWNIIHDMANRGILSNMPPNSQDFDLKNAGKHQYALLKAKKKNGFVKNIVMWSTLIVAAISATYGILTCYAPLANSQPYR